VNENCKKAQATVRPQRHCSLSAFVHKREAHFVRRPQLFPSPTGLGHRQVDGDQFVSDDPAQQTRKMFHLDTQGKNKEEVVSIRRSPKIIVCFVEESLGPDNWSHTSTGPGIGLTRIEKEHRESMG
jgi:hypothetical protein